MQEAPAAWQWWDPVSPLCEDTSTSSTLFQPLPPSTYKLPFTSHALLTSQGPFSLPSLNVANRNIWLFETVSLAGKVAPEFVCFSYILETWIILVNIRSMGKREGGYHGGRQGASHNKGDMHCFLHLRYPCAAIPMITSPIDMIFYYYLLLHICNKYCNCKILNILTIALKSCFDTLRKSRCQLLLLLTTSNVKVPPPLQVLQTLFWATSISWLHLV